MPANLAGGSDPRAGDRRSDAALRATPPRRPPHPSVSPRGATYVPRHERPITWDTCPEPRHLHPLERLRCNSRVSSRKPAMWGAALARSWPQTSRRPLFGLQVPARSAVGLLTCGTRLLELIGVEACRNPWASAVEQRPVVLLDHPHGRAHHACQLEHGHARGRCPARERRAQVVDPSRFCGTARLDAGVHSRRGKLSRLSSPQAGAGDSSGVSSRGGNSSSAASARVESGT